MSHLPAHRQKAAATLFIQLPGKPVLEINISLITFEHPFANLGQLDAPVLHAAIGGVQAVLQFQLEIFRLPAAPDQKSVQFDRLFRRAFADDGLVFYAPELRIAIPSIERLAVKDRFKPRAVVQRQRIDTRPSSLLPTRRALRRILLGTSLLSLRSGLLNDQTRCRE